MNGVSWTALAVIVALLLGTASGAWTAASRLGDIKQEVGALSLALSNVVDRNKRTLNIVDNQREQIQRLRQEMTAIQTRLDWTDGPPHQR